MVIDEVCREFHVLPGRQGRNQVEELEYEADLGPAEFCQLSRRQRGDVEPVDDNPPACRGIQDSTLSRRGSKYLDGLRKELAQ